MAAETVIPAKALPSGATAIRAALPIHALWATTLVSIFGNALTGIAVPWFVMETTGSASRTGLTAAVTLVPVVFAHLFGGALVDRTSYRGLSVFSDILSAATVAAIPVLYLTVGLDFGALLALMFLGAIFDSPGNTARTAMVPPLSRLTGMPLERINANFGMITAASALFSAPFAGIMIAWLGPISVLWFNAGTFLLSSLLVLLFVPRLPRPASSGESFMADVRSGYSYVRNHPSLRTLILGALSVNFLFAPLFGVAVPWFANQELHSVRLLGIMLGGEALGALLGSWLYGRFGNRVKRHTFLLAALALLSIPLYPLALATNVWTATALLAVVGTGSGLVNPMLGTFLQMTTPGHLMGRVTGLVGAGAMTAQPVGLLLGGTVVAAAGFQSTALLIAILVSLVAVAIALAPSLRGLDDLDPAPDGSGVA